MKGPILLVAALLAGGCTKTISPYVATTFPNKCGSAIQCYNLALEQLVAAREEAKASIAAALPLGAVVASADEGEPPGWLKCDGAEKDAVTYPRLAQLLGARYGSASPGKFRLPDYRGYFLRGWDPDRVRDAAARDALRAGAVSGTHVGSVEGDSVGDHRHPYQYYRGGGGTLGGAYADEHSHEQGSGSTEQTGTNSAGAENRPKNISVNYLIRADVPQ